MKRKDNDMRRSLFLAGLAVLTFNVSGMENIPNFGNYPSPSHSPERNRVNVDATTTSKLNLDKNPVLTSINASTIFGNTVQSFLNGELNDIQKKNLVVSLFDKVVDQENQIEKFTKKISDLENMNQALLLDQIYLLQQSINSMRMYSNYYQNIPSTGINLQNSNVDLSLNQGVSRDVSTQQDSLNSSNPATASFQQEVSSDETFLPVLNNSSQQESLPFSFDFQNTDMSNLNFDDLDLSFLDSFGEENRLESGINQYLNSQREFTPGTAVYQGHSLLKEALGGKSVSVTPVVESNIRNEWNYLKFTDNDIHNAWRYLKILNKKLKGPQAPQEKRKFNVFSFYKYKFNEYEDHNTAPKKSIRGNKLEFRKNKVREEVRKYFGVSPRIISRMFTQYKRNSKVQKNLNVTDEEYNKILEERRKEYNDSFPARNVEAEVSGIVQNYKEKHNILDVLNNARSDVTEKSNAMKKSEAETKKIIKYLRETGFGYHRIIELLGLRNDFETNYLPTVANQTDFSDNEEAFNSSSSPQTKKRKANTIESESPDPKKQRKGKNPSENMKKKNKGKLPE